MFFSGAGSRASGPHEMDLPELAEDTRDGTFHKDISIGSLLGLLSHSHRHHQFVHRERVIAGQIVPGDGQNFQ
jgi:hypothetical protein